MAEKNKSGAGKFFLGALLGGVAGAVAGKFLKVKFNSDEECGCDEECDCGGKCGDKCKCDADDSTKEIKEIKKDARSKTKTVKEEVEKQTKAK